MRRITVFLALLLSTSASNVVAARGVLERFEYYSPATFDLTVTRQQESTPTAKGVKNEVVLQRITARDLLIPVVAVYGGKLADWRLVAYSSSHDFEDVSDLALMARNIKTRDLAPVAALSLDGLGYLDARSSAYSVTRSENGDLLSAKFDQKYLVTCQQSVLSGNLAATGSLTHSLSYAAQKAHGLTIKSFKPGPLRLVLTGTYTTESAGTGVAELVLTLAAPTAVPVYYEIDDGGHTGGTGGVINVGGVDVSIGSPN